MNNTNKLLLVGMCLAFFAFAPLGNAQNAGSMYGTQVLETSGEFRPDLDAGVDIDGADLTTLWSDGEDDEIFTDDVIILDVDDDGDASQYDLVLASGGYDGAEPGDLVDDDQIDLLGLAWAAIEMHCAYADVNENDFLDEEDFLYLSTDDDAIGWQEHLEATEVGGARATIRLTETDDGAFGSLVRTTHDDF